MSAGEMPINGAARNGENLLRLAPILVLGVALIVRLVYFWEVASMPWFAQPVLDGRYNWNLAQLWATGAIWNEGPFFRPPLYGALLGALRALLGESAIPVALFFQHLLGCLGALALFFAARSASGTTAGVVAGLLYALSAPVVFYEGELLSDSLFANLTCFFLAALFASIRRRGDLRMAALAGMFAGLALITRPNILFVLAAFAAVGVAVAYLRRSRQPSPYPSSIRKRAVAIFVLCLMPLPLLATLYNIRSGTAAFVATQGGINFYIGNSPGANGLTVGLPIPIMPDDDYRDAVEVYAVNAARQADPTLNNAQVSRYWTQKALKFLSENPHEAAALYLRKTAALFGNQEVRNNRDFHFIRTQVRSLWLIPVTFGFMTIAAALGLLAIACAPRRRSGLGALTLIGAAAMGLSIVLFFVGGRLRLPIVPFMAILGGIGIADIIRRWPMGSARNRQKLSRVPGAKPNQRTARFAAILIVSITAGILAFYPREETHAYPAGDWFMLATASADAGRHQAAFDYASEALKSDPDLAQARNLRGTSALNLQEFSAAACDFAKLTTHPVLAPRAFNNLAVTAEAVTDYETALAFYSAAERASNGDPRYQLRRALLLARMRGISETSATLAALPESARRHPIAMALLIASGSVPAPAENTLPPQVQAALRELRAPLKPPRRPMPAPFDGSWQSTCGCPPLLAREDALTSTPASRP